MSESILQGEESWDLVSIWDVQTVKQALHMSRNERIDRKIEEDENAQDIE